MPTFMLDFNRIWILSIDSHKGPQYQVSRKCLQWELRWFIRTNGQTGRQSDMTKLH